MSSQLSFEKHFSFKIISATFFFYCRISYMSNIFHI